jgi:adenylate cyclase
MSQLSALNSALLPEKEIQYLVELADHTCTLLQQYYTPSMDIAVENLAQLADALSLLRCQFVEHAHERDNLLALVGIGQVVNSSLQVGDVLRIVMDTIVRLTGAERGFLMLRNKQGELIIHVARNWEQETLEVEERAFSRTVINRVVASGQPVLTTNAQNDPRFDRQESVIVYNLRSILCVPLKVKGQQIGVIYADNRVRAGLFTEKERDLLTAFADQAAVAIENARLFESVRHALSEATELKNLMDDIFASIASGVITADLQGKITLSNRAAETILKCSHRELSQQKISEILPELTSGGVDYLAQVIQDNRQIVGLEYAHDFPGYGPVNLNFSLSPLKDSEQTTRGVAIVLDDLTEKKRLEAQRRLFKRMVSPVVVEQLDPDELQLGGKRAEITTLFADIRGFTSFSEQTNPEQLVSVLNAYLGCAIDAVLAQEGTVNKFMGDAVMAIFNAPLPQKDHTLRAVRAALGMRAAISALHQELPPQYRLSFGVGIHFGEAILGLVGTQKRMEYTAIGDSVNTAKRIQEHAGACQILLSEQAFAQVCEQVKAQLVPLVSAKGKRHPLMIYEVLDLKA